MTHKLEILYQLTLGKYRTTPLIEAIQDRGVSIGISATNKLRLLRSQGYVMGVKDDQRKEKMWSITETGRNYLKEKMNPKPVKEYKYYQGQGYLI